VGGAGIQRAETEDLLPRLFACGSLSRSYDQMVGMAERFQPLLVVPAAKGVPTTHRRVDVVYL